MRRKTRPKSVQICIRIPRPMYEFIVQQARERDRAGGLLHGVNGLINADILPSWRARVEFERRQAEGPTS